MKKFVLLVSGLLSCASMDIAKDPEMDHRIELFNQIADSSVKVETDNSMGSGTVVYSKGLLSLVLTCAHVVMDLNAKGAPIPNRVQVVFYTFGSPATRFAYVEAIDLQSDLALLAVIDKVSVKPMHLAAREPELYERLYTVASPLGVTKTAAEGILANKEVEGPTGLLVWSVVGYTAPGSSGGTIANGRGELVCVPEAVPVVHGTLLSQPGMCIPLPRIRTFLAPYV